MLTPYSALLAGLDNSIKVFIAFVFIMPISRDRLRPGSGQRMPAGLVENNKAVGLTTRLNLLRRLEVQIGDHASDAHRLPFAVIKPSLNPKAPRPQAYATWRRTVGGWPTRGDLRRLQMRRVH